MAIIILVLASILTGCADPPAPPATEIPRVVVDFLEREDDTNSTIFYIHGVEDTRYTNISLYINNTLVSNVRDSYSLEYHADGVEFNVSIRVQKEEQMFYFTGLFILVNEDDLIYNLIQNEEIEEIKRHQLPFINRLSRTGEEENA